LTALIGASSTGTLACVVCVGSTGIRASDVSPSQPRVAVLPVAVAVGVERFVAQALMPVACVPVAQ
jgi:hypothetical protein